MPLPRRQAGTQPATTPPEPPAPQNPVASPQGGSEPARSPGRWAQVRAGGTPTPGLWLFDGCRDLHVVPLAQACPPCLPSLASPGSTAVSPPQARHIRAEGRRRAGRQASSGSRPLIAKARAESRARGAPQSGARRHQRKARARRRGRPGENPTARAHGHARAPRKGRAPSNTHTNARHAPVGAADQAKDQTARAQGHARAPRKGRAPGNTHTHTGHAPEGAAG